MDVQYKRIKAQTLQGRRFTIVVGLHEGFDPEAGVTHYQVTAQRALIQWMERRGARQMPYLNGLVTSGGYIDSHGGGAATSVGGEPAIEFTGIISTSYLADMSNQDIEDMLEEMAATLGAVLGQIRVEIAFMDRAWAIVVQQP